MVEGIEFRVLGFRVRFGYCNVSMHCNTQPDDGSHIRYTRKKLCGTRFSQAEHLPLDTGTLEYMCNVPLFHKPSESIIGLLTPPPPYCILRTIITISPRGGGAAVLKVK